MFEKYTERAVAVITTAQDISKDMKHDKVYPEHFLLGLYLNKYGICAKLFSLYNIEYTDLYQEVQRLLFSHRELKTNEERVFAKETRDFIKNIYKKAKEFGNSSILYEHIFITILIDNEDIIKLLKRKGFDIDNAKKILLKLLSKKSRTKVRHPEDTDSQDTDNASAGILAMLNEDKTKSIFENALSKLSTTGYEILGTEQILQSILDTESELKNTLQKVGLSIEEYNRQLEQIKNRNDEFCGRQIIFTPNAFKSVLLSIEIANELGSAELKPEHIILGILKNKSGIAYNIIKSFKIDENYLYEKILKSAEREFNETLMILRFAKEEALKIGTSVVGSEMILLGIIIESYGIGARTLNKLGITLQDVRNEVSKIIENGDRDFDTDLSFSKRAKKILGIAWEHAQKNNKTAINSEDLLIGITTQKKCIAMQVLTSLGVDIIEIKQGILNELEKDKK